jgi:hypothetical protein
VTITLVNRHAWPTPAATADDEADRARWVCSALPHALKVATSSATTDTNAAPRDLHLRRFMPQVSSRPAGTTTSGRQPFLSRQSLLCHRQG